MPIATAFSSDRVVLDKPRDRATGSPNTIVPPAMAPSATISPPVTSSSVRG